MQQVMVVLVTVGNEDEAAHIARSLVSEKLAACVNILPSIRSIYSWQGEICDDPELLLIIKTQKSLFPDLKRRIQELHSYDVAEVIALPVDLGSADYLDWVVANTEPTH